MDVDCKVAAREIVRSLALLASIAACSGGPEADGDPDFSGPPPFGNTNTGSPGGTAAGGSSAAGGGIGVTDGSSGLGTNGEGVGNPPITNGSNGGSGNATGSAGSGNPGGTAGNSGAGGSSNVGAGGTASVPPAAGGAGGTDPGNTGGAAGTQQMPPVEEPPEPLPGGFYLIDDFEGGRDPAWIESEVGGGAGTFTLDTALGANGSASSMRIDSNNQFHTMLQFALPQAVRTANEVYGRVYLRLAANPSPSHYIWVEVGTTANDGHEMRLGHNVGRLQSNHWLNGEQDIRDRNRSLVANTWYCLEFFMSNNPDRLQVWLDEQETALSTNNYTAGPNAEGNTNPVADFIPELDAFRIGWELQNGTVWFDDVALADSRIGCE